MALKTDHHKGITVCLVGYGLVMLLDLISAIIASIFINIECFEVSHLSAWVFITHFIVVFIGCLYVAGRVEEGKTIPTFAIAVAYYITKSIVSYLAFGGVTVSIYLALIPIILAVPAAVLLSASPKKRSRRRKIKR